ncbi:HIRAN domain-containing protein [Cellulomonas hominis]
MGLLTVDADGYTFRYVQHVTTLRGFRPLLGFGRLDQVYSSTRLFPLFAQRAMDPRRPDYERYVTELGLDPRETTPWEQISRSTGRRQGDTLQLVPVPRAVEGQVVCPFLVHGIRHMPTNALTFHGEPHPVTFEEVEHALAELRPGAQLTLVPEPTNVKNPEAIMVVAGQTPVGYVPDLLVHDLRRLMQITQVTASVIRVNPPDAPAHLRMLAELRASGAGDFEFFRDDRWRPVA